MPALYGLSSPSAISSPANAQRTRASRWPLMISPVRVGHRRAVAPPRVERWTQLITL